MYNISKANQNSHPVTARDTVWLKKTENRVIYSYMSLYSVLKKVDDNYIQYVLHIEHKDCTTVNESEKNRKHNFRLLLGIKENCTLLSHKL